MYKQSIGKGQVTLPVEEYNKLVDRANALERAMRIRKIWDTLVEIEIDADFIYPLARKLFEESRYVDSYKLVELEDFFVSSIRIAENKKESTEENLSE